MIRAFIVAIFVFPSLLLGQTGKPFSFGARPPDFENPKQKYDAPPKLKEPLEISLPDSLAKRKVHATVYTALYIDEKGNVSYGIVTKSSGNRVLDSLALFGAKAGWFTPAMHKGKPVASRVTIPVEFHSPGVSDEWEVEKDQQDLKMDVKELQKSKNMLEEEQRKLEEQIRKLKERKTKPDSTR